MALLVAGQHAVLQLEQDHAHVLDVHDRVEPRLAAGSKMGKRAHRGDPPRRRAGQPVDDVDVVRALLQEQAGGVAAIGVPVAEVEVAAVTDEVAAPHRLHVADRAFPHEVSQQLHERHVAHVVTDVQP